jgi:hypothetical protein
VAVRHLPALDASRRGYRLTSTALPSLTTYTSMAVHVVPCVVVIDPLSQPSVPRILLEGGI